MNLEDYNVEITTTPEDVKFTERCEAAGLPLVVISMYKPALKRLVADEREKVAQWMIQQGYATGHGDTVEDLLKELEWQIAENWTNALVKGVEGERKVIMDSLQKQADMATDALDRRWALEMIAAVASRSSK